MPRQGIAGVLARMQFRMLSPNMKYTRGSGTNVRIVSSALFHLRRQLLLTMCIKLFPANLLHKAVSKACRRPIIVARDEEEKRATERQSHVSGQTTSVIIENRIALSPLACRLFAAVRGVCRAHLSV